MEIAETRTGCTAFASKESKRLSGGVSRLPWAIPVYESVLALFVTVVLSLLCSGSVKAQEPAPADDSHPPAKGNMDLPNKADASDGGWHLFVSPYLWFPGAHGSTVALGQPVGVHASADDLLSETRFGLMSTVELQHKRWAVAGDIFWVRLEDKKALTFPPSLALSADFKSNEILFSPRVNYRVIDHKIFKIDGLAGFRYWHLGENVQLTPTIPGLNFSGSQDWVDPLVGGRIGARLSPRVEALLSGDVGGWGLGSQLQYQILGLLGYDLTRNLTMGAGYRYLAVDYRSGSYVYNIVSSGIVIGARIRLK